MTSWVRFPFAVIAACVVSLCATVVAQQGAGAIAGVIVDPNDKPITGYTGGYVTMRNAATGMESRADIKLDGTFELAGLAPGTYEFGAPITGGSIALARLTGGDHALVFSAPAEIVVP